VKKYLTNFRKDWNKFPEIFHRKFAEISELNNPTSIYVIIAAAAAAAARLLLSW